MENISRRTAKQAAQRLDFLRGTSVTHPMADLDPARIQIVEAIKHLEDALSSALPGQAPTATQHQIQHAIRSTRQQINQALKHIQQAEEKLRE